MKQCEAVNEGSIAKQQCRLAHGHPPPHQAFATIWHDEVYRSHDDIPGIIEELERAMATGGSARDSFMLTRGSDVVRLLKEARKLRFENNELSFRVGYAKQRLKQVMHDSGQAIAVLEGTDDE